MSQAKRRNHIVETPEGERLKPKADTTTSRGTGGTLFTARPSDSGLTGSAGHVGVHLSPSRDEIEGGDVANTRNGQKDFPNPNIVIRPRIPEPSQVQRLRRSPDRSTTQVAQQTPMRAASDVGPSIQPVAKGDTPPAPGTMPRTSSIDSAISSISSTSHAQKTAVDFKDPTADEIQTLVEAAGSVENLVLHLLRENKHSAQQNGQLWKLVDKQRALLLGLGKDLDRLTKEKDRYKRKLREAQGQTLSSPTLPEQRSQQLRNSQSPHTDGPERTTDSPPVQPDAVIQTPPSKHTLAPGSSPIDPAMMPSPLHLGQLQKSTLSAAPTQQSESTSSLDGSIEDEAMESQQSAVAAVAQAETDAASTPEHQQSVSGLHHLGTILEPPSVNVTEPSPKPQEKASKSFSTARKAPAPLNLKQSKASTALAQPIFDSEQQGLDQATIVYPSPPVERGRRKTREDDDKDREVQAMKEEEARSQSKKESASKNGSHEKVQETTLTLPKVPVSGLPLSPRMPPPSLQSALAPSGMLTEGALLNAHSHDAVTERLVTAPLKSPGLPTSPRPGDRPFASPMPRVSKDTGTGLSALPMSPRISGSGFPLTPRAPRSAIPLPPGSRLNNVSLANNNGTAQASTTVPASESNVTSPSVDVPHIYRGLMVSAYPELLLPPNALPSIAIKVASSRLRPSTANSMVKAPDAPSVFSLSIFSRSDGEELWCVEKPVFALPQLDQALRTLCSNLPRVPERKLFDGHAPATVDARRNSLNDYFDELLDTEMNEDTAIIICRFLSTDAIDPQRSNSLRQNPTTGSEMSSSEPHKGKPAKVGYLTKRGKNFGGWKSRYYILERGELRCYDHPGGPHLSTIKLQNAQIGRQSAGSSPTSNHDDPDENQYRHAFLILEPKKKDSNSLVKHVLCAESDVERDEWVETLLLYVDDSSMDRSTSAAREAENPSASITSHQEIIRSVNYADTAPGASPTMATHPASSTTGSSHLPAGGSHTDPAASKGNISSPMNGAVISDASSWGNKPAVQTKERKRNIFHFKQKPSVESVGSNLATEAAQNVTSRPRNVASQPIFGLPLAEAVETCGPIGVDVDLPAVVYRCIEYLQAKDAANEEGLFRLSGSNTLVKALKERFNQEGDVDLLAEDQYYDVHAIASLLKSYLRELPTTSVLTKNLHLNFLHVSELSDPSNKITAFNSLVHQLPPGNYTLLQSLSSYLLQVVQKQERNKMNVRNLALIFSPTLNLPVPIIVMFLSEYHAIFDNSPSSSTSGIEPTIGQRKVSDDVRSPRKQMFTDLPTPVVGQTPNSGIAPQHSTSRGPATYPTRQPYMQQQSNTDAAYGSLNRMMAPSNTTSEKAKRRESSMLML